MRHPTFALLTTTAVVCLCTQATGQEKPDAFQRLAVTVTAANGPILTINRGQSSGLRKGDTVVFRRAGRLPLTAVVRRVDERESRLELEDFRADVLVTVGLRGEALVPSGRAVADGSTPGTPDHPPWEEPVGPWAEGKPLLAPASSPSAKERNSDFYGRVFTRYQTTDDSLVDRRYERWWTGVDFDWGNPLGNGGALRFKGDTSLRNDGSTNGDGQESISRIQRMSYSVGNSYDAPQRLEIGRFLPSLFPQFGLVDGAEYVQRLDSGDQIGTTLGFLPDYTDNLRATSDLSTAVFYRWVESPEELLSMSVGLQKTWYDGQADRDLLACNLQWSVNPSTTVRASALADYYDSSAVLKSTGLELTEFHCSVDQRFGNSAGASIYGSYFNWPELLKNSFPTPPPQTISDQQVSRGGVSGWARVSKGVNVYGRFDGWSDNLNSGTFADLRVDMRDLLYDQSELSVGVYDTQGSFSDGLGARIRHTHWIGATTIRLAYETVRFDQSGFLGTQSQLLQHILRLGVDSRLARDLDLSGEVAQRFGDEQDSLTMGLRLTWRF